MKRPMLTGIAVNKSIGLSVVVMPDATIQLHGDSGALVWEGQVPVVLGLNDYVVDFGIIEQSLRITKAALRRADGSLLASSDQMDAEYGPVMNAHNHGVFHWSVTLILTTATSQSIS